MSGAIILDGATLTPAAVASVARDGTPVELDPAARARNQEAHAAIAKLLERGDPLYGATTGVGALRDRTIEDADRERFQWNLLRSHAVSAGRPVEPELVRAGMAVRANQLGGGGAGVAPELLDRLVSALNAGVTPLTRELGSLGTGDLPALADIALTLLGEGKVWRGNELIDAPPPQTAIELGLRDALGFMSSNAMTAGHAALIVVDARALQARWLEVAALSFEALHADPVVLDPRVQAARRARGQAAVAARMRELLAGAPFDPRSPDRLVQDPYPFRVLPQVDGVAHDALDGLDEVVGRELNARPENALIHEGRAYPTGNFHAAELGAGLDALRAAFGHSASLIAGRVSALLDPRMSGLPPFLAGDPGPDSGHMMLEYTAHAAAAEIRSLATPMAVQSVWASLGVESHASLAATAATRTAEMVHAMNVLVATELAVAVRALRMADRVPRGAGVRALYATAVQTIAPGTEDRAFGGDVEAARRVLAARSAR
ncbi:MAG: aromatic amino acid lyase [Solirubrobacterales bacterium]|nr:aromatic amino acid lyase [Solirubrobacterales bacterium]